MNQPLFDQTQPANTGDPLETYLAKHNLIPKDLINPNGSFTHHALAFAFEHGGANPSADPRLFVSSLEGGLKRLMLGVVDVKPDEIKGITKIVRDYLFTLPKASRRGAIEDLNHRESLQRPVVIRYLRENGIVIRVEQLKAAVEIVWQEYQGGSR